MDDPVANPNGKTKAITPISRAGFICRPWRKSSTRLNSSNLEDPNYDNSDVVVLLCGFHIIVHTLYQLLHKLGSAAVTIVTQDLLNLAFLPHFSVAVPRLGNPIREACQRIAWSKMNLSL